MVSKYIAKKREAFSLRENGWSIRDIELKLCIPRSTLSGWLRHVELTQKQKEHLHREWIKGLEKARSKARVKHMQMKEMRVLKALNEAKEVFKKVNVCDEAVLELLLAMLYWGEGAKTGNRIFIGNSNPDLLKFFLDGLIRVYKLPRNSVRCALHLRADQNPDEMKRFWSRALQIPVKCIREVYFDSRTKGLPTWPNYYGVCSIVYFNSHLWRRLLSFRDLVCQVELQNKGT